MGIVKHSLCCRHLVLLCMTVKHFIHLPIYLKLYMLFNNAPTGFNTVLVTGGDSAQLRWLKRAFDCDH